MKISNPFYGRYRHARFRFNGGTLTATTTGPEVEAPDDVKDCLIEPISGGRSDCEAVGPGLMWTPDSGFMDLKAYSQKLDLMEQRKKLQEEQEAHAAKKAKEARERGKMKDAVAEKPKKVVKEFIARKGKDVGEVVDTPMDMGKELEL